MVFGGEYCGIVVVGGVVGVEYVCFVCVLECGGAGG